MQDMLLLLAQSANETTGEIDHWQTACDWLKANPNTWAEWVPDKTICSFDNLGLKKVSLHV